MPFTYSIANGISFGIVSYALIKLLAGKGRDVHFTGDRWNQAPGGSEGAEALQAAAAATEIRAPAAF